MNWPWTLTKVTVVDLFYDSWVPYLLVKTSNGRLYTKRIKMHAGVNIPNEFDTRLFFWKAI